jgi:hypothetical protein
MGVVRFVTLLAVPFAIGYGLAAYSGYLEVVLAQTSTRYGSIVHAMAVMKDAWIMWMWLNAALLAALLLFLRGTGYRLIKSAKVADDT